MFPHEVPLKLSTLSKCNVLRENSGNKHPLKLQARLAYRYAVGEGKSKVRLGRIITRKTNKKDTYAVKWDDTGKSEECIVLSLNDTMRQKQGAYGRDWVALEETVKSVLPKSVHAKKSQANQKARATPKAKAQTATCRSRATKKQDADRDTSDTTYKAKVHRAQAAADKSHLRKQSNKRSYNESKGSDDEKECEDEQQSSDDDRLASVSGIVPIDDVQYPRAIGGDGKRPVLSIYPDKVVRYDLDKFRLENVPIRVLQDISNTLKSAKHIPVGHEQCGNIILAVSAEFGVISIQCPDEGFCCDLLTTYLGLANCQHVGFWKWRKGVSTHLLADPACNHTWSTRCMAAAASQKGIGSFCLTNFGMKVDLKDAGQNSVYSIDASQTVEEIEARIEPSVMTYDIGVVYNMGNPGEACVVTMIGPDFAGKYAKQLKYRAGKGFHVYRQFGIHGQDELGNPCGTILFEPQLTDSMGNKVIELPIKVEVDGIDFTSISGVERVVIYTEFIHLLKVTLPTTNIFVA